jgi:hypothetical protein
MKNALVYLILAAFAVFMPVSDSSGADIKVAPEEAVRYAESWLAGNGDVFRAGGDKVRTVVEYKHVYLMILSPSGWMTLLKTDDKNFRPLSFGEGKLNRETFEKSLWGETGGAEGGVVVYENP